MTLTIRCSICDRVNSADISNLPGNYSSERQVFRRDPKSHLHFICLDCSEEINELKNDYDIEDYFNGENEKWMDGFKL